MIRRDRHHPTTLPADLAEGLKRLKMAAMRSLAPELLVTAKTQRWNPEEFLRTLVEAEITARDASNAATRRRAAAFPVVKTLEQFDVAASSIPRATFDYLSSLEWVRAAENVCLIGPAGTGKSHMLVALGISLDRPAGGPFLSRVGGTLDADREGNGDGSGHVRRVCGARADQPAHA